MFRRHGESDVKVTRRNADRPLRNLLVTGGCGFIGSNFINHFMKTHPGVCVYNLDKLDYCANPKNIEQSQSPRYHFILGDVTNRDLVMHVLVMYDIDTIIHFAAQSHVDNSFGNSLSFTVNNVLGTHNLLECTRVYDKVEKFIHVSTDEVYGEVTESQQEEGTLNPTNPYAATKAAAEHIVKSYYTSFGLPVLVTRGNNVYGPYQYPEKVIPRFLMLARAGEKLTIQGTGTNTRSFIHSSDVATAFETLIDKGIIGEVYNIGSRDEISVLEIARRVISALHGPDEAEGDRLKKHLVFVKDRGFNDQRYDVDSEKLESLGWKRAISFDDGFRQTVEWYRKALDDNYWLDVRRGIPDSASVPLLYPF